MGMGACCTHYPSQVITMIRGNFRNPSNGIRPLGCTPLSINLLLTKFLTRAILLGVGGSQWCYPFLRKYHFTE